MRRTFWRWLRWFSRGVAVSPYWLDEQARKECGKGWKEGPVWRWPVKK